MHTLHSCESAMSRCAQVMDFEQKLETQVYREVTRCYMTVLVFFLYVFRE